jgi:hypothetical protein
MSVTLATPAVTFWDMPEDITRYIMELSKLSSLNDLVLRVADKIDAILAVSCTNTEDLDARGINTQYQLRSSAYSLDLWDTAKNVIASLDATEYTHVFGSMTGRDAYEYLYTIFIDTYQADFINTGNDRYVMRLVGYGNMTYNYDDSDSDGNDDEYDSDSDSD